MKASKIVKASAYKVEGLSLHGVQSSTCNICPGYTGPNVSTLQLMAPFCGQ